VRTLRDEPLYPRKKAFPILLTEFPAQRHLVLVTIIATRLFPQTSRDWQGDCAAHQVLGARRWQNSISREAVPTLASEVRRLIPTKSQSL